MTELLTGVRVVSLATNLPGPMAAAGLAAFGASVIKVEPPTGDALAVADPGWYHQLVSGQEVQEIDLKSEIGATQLSELLADADALLTSSRPAALERLGLSGSEVSAKFPRLCHVAIVGHGDGEADRPGHDLTYQAEAGLVDGATVPRAPYADLAGAERAVSEVCAALLGRALHGKVNHREVSLATVANDMATPLRRGLTAPKGPLGGGDPVYRMYPAQDGYIAVACLEPHFRRRLLNELAVDGSQSSLERAFRTDTMRGWEQWAKERDLPLARVIT